MMQSNKPHIIIPFTLPWNWSADFQRQTAYELINKGYSVTAYLNDDSEFFLKTFKKKYPKIKNLSFYIPKYYIPFRRFHLIEKLNKHISRMLFSLSILTKKKIIWIFDPEFHNFSNYFINKISIYDCVDYAIKKLQGKENKLIQNSDFFFVNSNSLKTIHKNKKDTITLVPQGFNLVDFKKYSQGLAKKRTKKITIGYVGGINSRLKFDSLYQLAKKNPQWNFSFWGPIQYLDKKNQDYFRLSLQRLKRLANTSFNSTNDKAKLIRVINSFDICLIPYDTKQKFNLYCYPMKVFEYFYLGKPVIATPIKELMEKKFSQLLYIANTSDEFEKTIHKILGSEWKHQKKQVKLAQQNSWENKVGMILKKISAADIMR